MNKRELAAKVAASSKIQQKLAEKVINSVLDEIKTAMVTGGSVRMNEFGTFTTQVRSARLGRNPRTGEEVLIPATRVARFRPSRGLKDLVAGDE